MAKIEFSEWGSDFTEVESAFVSAFSCHSSTTVADCGCGRTYFTSCPTGGDFDEGELEELQANREKEPDLYFETNVYDSIEIVAIGGEEYIPQCKCGFLRPYIQFMEIKKEQLAMFLIERFRQSIGDKERQIKRERYLLSGVERAKETYGKERDEERK